MNEEMQLVESGGNALESITRGEVDVAIATAKRYPRQLAQVRNRVLTLATMDEETAAACFYSLPRAGKTITGESVRLAEILVASYGNLRAGSRPVHVDLNRGVVTVQGVCHDLENNIATTVEKTRKIERKKNATGFSEDMVTLATNAACSIAYRDAVFKVVPKAIIKPILAQIKEAARGKGTLDQRVKRIVDRFAEMGVPLKRILATLGIQKQEEMTLEHLDMLIGIGTAIRDGEMRVSDAFPDAAPAVEAPRTQTTAVPAADSHPELEPASEPTAEATQADAVAALAALAANDGIDMADLQAWATAQKMDVTVEAHARRVINGWNTVRGFVLRKKGGAA